MSVEALIIPHGSGPARRSEGLASPGGPGGRGRAGRQAGRRPASLILTGVVTFHLVLGTIVLVSNLVVAVWGALVYRGRARPNQAFAQSLALSHASTVGQSVIGLLLLSSGNRAPQELHYVYGIVPPVLILFAYSSRTDDARRNIGVFALVAFLVLLVAARAYMTGRGIG